jgi:hypothetical protein
MTYRIEYLLEVADELAESYNWYESQRTGLGTQFLTQLGGTLEAVRERPLSFAAIDPNVRRALVRRFEFAVFFMLEGDVLVVLAISHARRSPTVWKRRAGSVRRGDNRGRWKDNS